MWRIFGLVFFGDREYFMTDASAQSGQNPKKVFSKPRLVEFLTARGIGLSDTARTVVRQKGNASDKFLQIVEPVDLAALLARAPECRYIVTTGDKATSTLASVTGAAEPPVGGFTDFELAGRPLRHYRMPSSSRAYPLAIEKKAEVYAAMMRQAGLL